MERILIQIMHIISAWLENRENIHKLEGEGGGQCTLHEGPSVSISLFIIHQFVTLLRIGSLVCSMQGVFCMDQCFVWDPCEFKVVDTMT